MEIANVNAKEATIEVRVIKADGTVVDYGVLGYWHKNPIRRLIWNLKKFFRRK